MDLNRKLAILADAAKYDASCASSGTDKRNSVGGRGIGSTEGSGICHSYAPDGRCISLLKILLTNWCSYDCLYCVNRVSSNVERARFTIDEVVELTLDFYRRNCIEGLFLSSGIIQTPDYTMEQLVEVARALREDHDFRGYVHLKTIPEADEALIARAGRYADRLSVNLELPTASSLAALAPEKSATSIRTAMGASRWHIVRQLLIESILLSALGGVLGLAMARFGIAAFSSAVQDVGKPYWVDPSMDYVVFGYFAALTVVAGIIFGIVPALSASRVNLNETLKEGSRSVAGAHGGRLSGALVVVQFTLAVVLLAARWVARLRASASLAGLPSAMMRTGGWWASM